MIELRKSSIITGFQGFLLSRPRRQYPFRKVIDEVKRFGNKPHFLAISPIAKITQATGRLEIAQFTGPGLNHLGERLTNSSCKLINESQITTQADTELKKRLTPYVFQADSRHL